jgi:hypothetical protein
MSHTYPPLLCDILLTYQSKSMKNEQKSNKKMSYFSSWDVFVQLALRPVILQLTENEG